MRKINNLQQPPTPSRADAAAEKIAKLEQELAALRGSTPPAIAPRRRRAKGTIQYLTDEELARLFAAIRAGGSVRDLAIWELAYHRGLRASEVGLIELRHLRPDLRRLFVSRLKNGTSAEYLLTEREVSALRAWLRRRGKNAGPLFPSREGRGRRAITRGRLHQLMVRYATIAGIDPEKRHFHCLRHSCATSLIDLDVGIEDVQDHLGHRHVANTQIYAKVTNKRRTRTGERLAREW